MKVSISNDILDQNVEKINEFLSKKGMSLIMGGDKELTILEPKWGTPIMPSPRGLLDVNRM